MYITSAIFLSTFVLQVLILLYRNVSTRHGHTRALISKQRGTVRMSISVPRLVTVEAGQYVNVWMPSISFCSFLQSHPFTIASWATQGSNITLDLMVTLRKGLTRDLYASAEAHKSFAEQSIACDGLSKMSRNNDRSLPYSSHGLPSGADDETFQESLEEGATGGSLPMSGYKNAWGDPQRSDFRLALFSRPHGRGIPVGDYGKVLMIATDSGIVAQLPYLQELMSGFNNCRVRTRDIHLIWQLHSIGTHYPYKPFLTDAFADDRRPASKLIDKILRGDIIPNDYVSSHPKIENLSF